MKTLQKPRASALAVALSVLIIMIALALCAPARAADSSTLVALAPPIQIVANVGDTFTEIVTIATSDQVNSINFTISFNATLLNVVSVVQGSFFPKQSPPTSFTVVMNSTAGTITISAKLLDPQTQTGNGNLATVVFMASKDPKSIIPNTIGLDQVLIMNAAHQPLTYYTINALWFWNHVEPPPPPPAPRVIDVYTQRGGIGPNADGGEFAAGSQVILSAYTTYNKYPVQHIPVAFQVLDAKNQTVAILAAFTDENGVATVEFRILLDQDVEGTWLAVASGDIACHIVWDTLNFTVVMPRQVGGYTITPPKQPDFTAQYLTTMTTLAVAFTITKRRLRKK